ncbi:MAG: Wzz/FepE/Etk N-terminal domain-containing protein [Candidatus Cryptobacteroides sp.]
MKQFDTDYEYSGDESVNGIDLAKFWVKTKASWKLILCCVGVSAVLGLIVGFSIPKKYKVVTKLAPELSNSAVNRLSSLANLAGMNANVLGSSDAVYPMIYPEIIYSANFMVDLFDMPVTLAGEEPMTLYEYVRDHSRRPWWSALFQLPGKLFALLKKEEDADPDAPVDPYRLTFEQAAVAKTLVSNIRATVEKKTMLITIETTMQDPVVAADLARYANEKLKKYVTDYRTDKVRETVEYLEGVLVQTRDDYYDAQKIYASYVDSHRNLVLQSVKVEAERLQNDMNMKYTLYKSVAQQLQEANLKVQQETPVFTEIVPASVPLRPCAPSKKKILAAFLFLGLVAGVAVAQLKK